MVGAGTWEDPRRPMFAPVRGKADPGSEGLLGYGYQVSDDGSVALVEFVARDRAAFKKILAHPAARAFIRGRDKRSDMEGLFRQYKRDFDAATFGVRIP